MVKSRVLFIIVFCVLSVLIVDVSIVRITTYTGGMYPLKSYLNFFVVLVVIFGTVSFLLLKFVNSKSKETKAFQKQPLRLIFIAMPVVQSTIIILLIVVVVQMLTTSVYSLGLLKAILYASYITGGILMAVLSFKFWSWVKVNRNLIVYLYLFATAMISCNAFLSVLSLQDSLTSKPDYIYYIRSLSGSCCPSFDAYSEGLSQLLNLSLILSFSLTWIATVLLLRNYSSKRGMVRYWILVAIPMIYFLSSFQSILLDTFSAIRILNPYLFDIGYNLFFSATRPVGGILFGIAFWNASRNISSPVIRNYLMISAYGMMICFGSNQSTGLAVAPYPPFGTITVAFFGLGSFLMLVGVYASAIGAAQDIALMKFVKSKARQLGLLKGIGISQMRDSTEKAVKKVMNDVSSELGELQELSGITPSIGEDDFKEYLKMALNEAKKKK